MDRTEELEGRVAEVQAPQAEVRALADGILKHVTGDEATQAERRAQEAFDTAVGLEWELGAFCRREKHKGMVTPKEAVAIGVVHALLTVAIDSFGEILN